MRLKRKTESATQNFEQFLKDNNCTYTVNKEENATVMPFEFQAGHFVASVRKQNDCVEITYPCMASAPISQLDLVRAKCNDRNNSNILFKFTYSIDHEENEVNVHMSFFNNRINAEEIKHELGAAFHFQREWHRDFDEAVALSKDNGTTDLESELYKNQREMFLLRRMEMHNQTETNTAGITTGTGDLPLWQLLDTVCPLPESRLLFMTVNTVEGQQRLEQEQEIRNFDLRHALVEGEGAQARLKRDYAVLDLHYKQGLDEKPRLLTVALTAEGDDAHSIYTRVTVTQVPGNVNRRHSLNNEERQARSVSLIIALDRTDDKQRQQEFDYMWSEAQLKAQNGEHQSMTEEQQLLSQINMADSAYNLYWGQKMFNAGRYYEASLYFENMFNSYRAYFFEMSAEHKRVFMEVAYKLGFCYNELGQHKQAFYYLDLMATDGNIRHTMELVNTMAGSKDLRLFNYTEGVMEEVKRNFNDTEELPENIRDLINFLRRRRGNAFIDFNQLDKAEVIFNAMLNEEENADYAIQQLATIQKLRTEREKSTAQPDKPKPKSNPDLPF